MRAHGLGTCEFLRRRGGHEQLRQWEAAAVDSLRGRKVPGKSAESRRAKELDRALPRKEKALPEAAALLVLRRKGGSPLGDEDASMDPKGDDESSS